MCTLCISNLLSSVNDFLIEATSSDSGSIFNSLFGTADKPKDENNDDEEEDDKILDLVNTGGTRRQSAPQFTTSPRNSIPSSADEDYLKGRKTLRKVNPVHLNKKIGRSMEEVYQKPKQMDITTRRRASVMPLTAQHDEVQYLCLHHEAAFSSHDGDDFKLGHVTMRLTHDLRKSALSVHLIEMNNLPKTQTFGECDSLAKLILYPGLFVEQKTKVHYRSRNPKFNETKVFKPVTESDLSTMTLNVKVYDWNRVMNNRLIGEVNCSLGIILDNDDGTNSNGKRSVLVHKNIIVPTNSEDYLGSVLMSLNLDLQSQQMKITIIKAKDLKAMDANNFSDPYCTIKLFSDDEKIGSRKTSIKYKTLNPIWNESFPFLVTPKAFQKHLKLQIRVYDKDITGKDFIGEIEFPSTPGSIEWKHWGNMVDNPAVTTAEWHSLKAKTKNS